MINFHKYSFLDCKKLKGILKDTNKYLYEYEPNWLFSFSDYYKPEIAFGLEYTYIRYNLPQVGLVYYPPIKNQGHNLKEALQEMESDALENGINLSLGPVADDEVNVYTGYSCKLYENRLFDTYVYSIMDLVGLSDNKKYKASIKEFNKAHKETFLKIVRKDDFSPILEFISTIREDNDEMEFYPKLNALKKIMDHLYELDYIGVILRDEKNTYGVAFGSVMDNCFYYHLIFADKKVTGAEASLISGAAKYASTLARFAAMPADRDKKELKEFNESLKPLRLEKYNATFNI